MTAEPPSRQARRDELLAIAAGLFAEKGFKNTTVRDIADAAGILSGSLYHHFDSKESMVDEILSTFQEELFAAYDEILASDDDARTKIERPCGCRSRRSTSTRTRSRSSRTRRPTSATFDRFAYLAERNKQSRQVWVTLLERGRRAGVLRADLDVELTYRFIRDTVWVAVRWYRPGGGLTHTEVADQYLTILLDGIAHA